MQENKSLVEEAFIHMKNVEEAIAENAKGILASTMKEEISQLVKESLSEQEDLDADDETSADEVDTVDDVNPESDSNELEDDMGMDMIQVDTDNPIDLSNEEDDEVVLKVFKSMGPDDGIIVKKDGEDVHLTDNSTDSEYLIKNLDESEGETHEYMEYNEDEDLEDSEVDQLIRDIFGSKSDEGDVYSSSEDDTMNEPEFEDSTEEEEIVYEIEFNEEEVDEETDEEMSEETDEEMSEETDEEMSEEVDEETDEEMSEEVDEETEEGWNMDESYSHKKVETKESKMSVKPKGVGFGNPSKFKYNKVTGGFKEDMKQGPKSVGTGSAKKAKVFPKGENAEVGKNKIVKKETKEGARTYALGSKEGRGLRKGVTPNRDFVYGKGGLKKESLESEVSSLREKNEEYRKALNVFREKLNEVAIFNSNLAYATRLFTEHSTTKKEKINILRRFDNVDSLKESKNLYRVVKEELTKTETKSLNESVGNKLTKSVQSGSSTTLIENKTYEAPQFLRIKDLMSKIG